jgi:hypothetical protein
VRAFSFVLLLGVLGCGATTLDEVSPEVWALEPTYEQHVRPLFETHCTSCHSSLGARAGGVELDQYESAFAGRVHQVCVTVEPEVVARFGAALTPFQRSGQPPRAPCEGWEVGSMPTGARSGLLLDEQVILARWVETGAAR